MQRAVFIPLSAVTTADVTTEVSVIFTLYAHVCEGMDTARACFSEHRMANCRSHGWSVDDVGDILALPILDIDCCPAEKEYEHFNTS